MVSGHPGEKRLEQTIKARCNHQNLQTEISKFKCAACHKFKLAGKEYGLLPQRELQEQLFQECAVDIIGPWPVIDPVANLTELARIDNKESEHMARNFAQTWLSRYPWPECCIHDNGGKFTGSKFHELLEHSNIKDVPTTSRNPTANAVCKRMHQTVGNVLRTLVHDNPPRGTRQAKDLVK